MKKAVQFSRTGVPSEVVELIDMETAHVGDDDALIDIEAAAINPSHLLTLSGVYGVQPELPAVPGAEGIGIILISSDLPEVLGTCDRILVLHDGHQAHLLDRAGLTSAKLLSYFYAAREAG